jgi:site-specific DNA-methyltransferase (adenine-specific)
MSTVQLLQGDCLELLPTLPSASVDLILCDLPYGLTACPWDSVIPLVPLWLEYKRVIVPGGAIVLTACQPFTSTLVMSNLRQFRYEWIWDKINPSGHLNAKNRPMRQHESVLVFCDRKPPYFAERCKGAPCHAHGKGGLQKTAAYGTHYVVKSDSSGLRYPRSIIAFTKLHNGANHRTHTTQKPVALMEYLIRTYTLDGATVLDSCFGSGTTGVACVQAGRNFIGIERDPTYFLTAQARISTSLSNLQPPSDSPSIPLSNDRDDTGSQGSQDRDPDCSERG